jgi:integrase
VAWLEKRKRDDGSVRFRVREIVGGRKVTIIKDAGRWRQLAEKILDGYERKKAAGENPEAQALAVTIDDALETWFREEPKEPRTVEEYRDALSKYRAHSRVTRVNEMSRDNIEAWRFGMDSGKIRFTRNGTDFHPYHPWSVWRLMRTMRAFLKFCFRRDWINHKLANSIRLSMPRSTKRFLSREEAARLIKACRLEKYSFLTGGNRTKADVEERVVRVSCEHPELSYDTIVPRLAESGLRMEPSRVRSIWRRYGLETTAKRRAAQGKPFVPAERRVVWVKMHGANNGLRRIMLFGLYTGMRLGEVLRAKWEHLSPEEILRRMPDGRVVSKVVYVLYIPIAKGDQERSVAIHPRLARILGIQKKFGKQKGPLFPGWTKKRLSEGRLDAVARAGLGRVRYHDLRHSFVRNYLKSGAGSIAQLREQTGHSDLASLQVYAHFSKKDVAETIDQMKIQ